MLMTDGLATMIPGPGSLFHNAREPAPTRPRLSLISSAEFATTEYKLEWLVEGLLVKGQPGVWGGPKKVLKTSTLVDLVLALGTPREHGPGKFLGRFEVSRPVRVALFSCESGEHTLQETAWRIARARGLDLAHADVHWGFTLPKVASQSDLDEIRRLVKDLKLEVVIIDPLYLSLLGGGVDVDPKNVFSMGPVLMDFARACLDHGCTPILAHHTKKAREKEEHKPLDLDDLAYSGIPEFARQWFLISRRSPYEDGTGRHELWIRAGGSAGFSGLYGVDVAEGTVDMRFAGRTWDVKVLKSDDVRLDQEQRKEMAKQKLGQRRHAELTGEALKAFQKEHAARLSIADLRRLTGWGPDKANRAIAMLSAEGILNQREGKASNGRRVTTFGLAQPPEGLAGATA